MVELPLVPMAAVVAMNVADDAAAVTATVAGTVSVELEFDRLTVAPPLGAGPERVTVQVLEELGPRLLGLHVSEDISAVASKLTLALAELLLYVAVIVELALLPMAAVVALKVAEVAAAVTETDAGTASAELEFDRVTLAPPLGAG